MAAITSTEKLTGALAEMQQLRAQSQQPIVQRVLDEQIRLWRVNLDEMNRREQLATRNNQISSSTVSSTTSSATPTVRPVKKLATYAFDESDKFIKLYYTVPGITAAPTDSVNAKFSENSFEVFCTNIDGVDYEINVQGLAKAINAEKCQVKQKSDDLLLVMLKKARENAMWGSLLKLEQKDTKKMPKLEDEDLDGGDPQASLMKLMKQMYDDGDDEMKRTIRKSWYEAQSQKGGSTLGGGGGMGGMMDE